MKDIANKDITHLSSNNQTSKEVNYLPNETLIGAMKYAKIARKRGELIQNDEVHKILATKLGWK